MTSESQFDAAQFEVEVLAEVEEILDVNRLANRPRAKVAASKKTKKEVKKDDVTRRKARIDRMFSYARSMLEENEELRKKICEGLISVSGDLTDIAKNLVYILTPLSFAGVVVPLDPALYAMLAFVVYRAGIKSICKSETDG